jgi:NADH-quinone oxidoreductase subunit L
MFEINTLLLLVPGLPLVATLVTAALGKRMLGPRSHWPAVVAIGLSLVASLLLVWQVHEQADHAGKETGIGFERVVTLWQWATVENAKGQDSLSLGERAGVRGTADGHSLDTSPHPNPLPKGEGTNDFGVAITLRADPLTAVMLATVTFVSLLVAVYSIGYMHDDPGYWRFFTYIALFVFSMTMLVAASNFLLLYVFWEAVGLCSYLLIGFWFQKPEAAAAGKKAFLVNRVGDFGFALGIFLIWITYGTLNFHDVVVDGQLQTAGVLGQTRLAHLELFLGGTVGTAICLLLMLGACGKSAQFPLHVWLPDAMEGPTPVSALIHAATMVTAGVYMVTRCMPLFLASPGAQQTVAVIGGVTALMAAIIAVTQTDLKRILAYSTISQLGYMFLGLGTATLVGVTAGMFHLFTHAFFKALLFLGAGSVMHAMGGVIDLRRFGGLRRVMPITHWTFLFGSLALAGIVPFAGFWSKDQILVALGQRAAEGSAASLYHVLFLMALGAAGLTAFYTFRAFFLTFYGPERIPREAHGHAHESPRVMTWPLVILAFCALVVGAYFEWTHGFAHFLAQTPSLAYVAKMAPEVTASAGDHTAVAIESTLVAVAGAGLAWFLYLGSKSVVDRLTRLMDLVGLYRLSAGKFFFDTIYNVLVVWPLEGIALMSAWFDRRVVDGLVNGVGRLPAALGTMLRPLAGGLVPFYALGMALGVLILIGLMLR